MLKRRGGPRRRQGAAGRGGNGSGSTAEGFWWLGWLCGACCDVMALCLGLARGPGARGGTQCGCEAGSGPYERLSTSPASQLELSTLDNESEDKDATTEKQEALLFHTESGRQQRVVVERHLCASHLCHVLALKFSVSPAGGEWSLIEHWPQLGIERSLEDHEKVLAVHRDAGRGADRKFIFRKDPKKYKFFENPRDFFPTDMVDLRGWEQIPDKDANAIPAQAPNLDWTPVVFSYVWVRERSRRSSPWVKAFLMLHGDHLYLCHKFQTMARFVRAWRSSRDNALVGREKNHKATGESSGTATTSTSTFLALSPSNLQLDPELRLLARLSDYNVYTTLNARNQLRAPTAFGLCLRPCEPSASPTSSPPSTPPAGGDMLCLAVESERTRLCWVTAMRLAKYGKQLRENYRLLRNTQSSSDTPGTSHDGGNPSSSLLSEEYVRSRVAMDFTGSVGRIVDDPTEARAVAEAEGDAWRRRWRPPVPRPSSALVATAPRRISNTATAHLEQNWFLGNVSREQAAKLLSRPGTLDGVFLVRESRSMVGSYVLSLRAGGKVVHTQIHLVTDAPRGTLCFSLDGGTTKFFDLLQLIEFYQLNSGCLPTRLLDSPKSGKKTSAIHPSSF